MDFVFKLPPTVQRHGDIWVVVDLLTKSAHFLPVRKKFFSSEASVMNHIVSLHGCQCRSSLIEIHDSLRGFGRD